MDSFRSGYYTNQGYYQSFQPVSINRNWQLGDMEVLRLLSRADRHLGRLDMFSEYVNIEMFIQMHIAKEATQSSKIEGTQTKIEDVFLDKDEIGVEKRNDWEEVQNYIQAMKESMQLLQELPFSSRLIKTIHKTLIQGVRGTHKQPGSYRSSQNWIGGATLDDAIFIPPAQHTVPELMSDLEKFANDDSNPLPELIKAAIIHYQFETIHPFLDGNGRVGRLLITIYLVSVGILKQPILYLSDFFERNRMHYYDNLMRVRTHNDMNQWIKFFLIGVIETSKIGIDTFNGILRLQEDVKSKLKELGRRSGDALKVIDYLYTKPIIDANQVSMIIGKTTKTGYALIHDLERLGIINEITGAERGKLYIFDGYVKLFKK